MGRSALVLVLVGACGDNAGPAVPEPLTATFTDLGAPDRVAALALDAGGEPVVFAAETGAGPWRVLAGEAWTDTGVSSPTSDVAFLRDPDGTPLAVIGGTHVYRDGAEIAIPDPGLGMYRIVGVDDRGRFTAVIEGGSIVLATWSEGDAGWALMDGSSQVGYEQGTLVTPDGAVFMSFSPISQENFQFERFDNGPPKQLASCNGLGVTIVIDAGVTDAASNVYVENCEHGALYVIPAGSTCYQPVVSLPAGVCGRLDMASDGTAFVFPTDSSARSGWRWAPGELEWTEIDGDIDGSQHYVATGAATLWRFGGALPGLARAEL